MELHALLVIEGRLDFDIDLCYIIPWGPVQCLQFEDGTNACKDDFFPFSFLKFCSHVADKATDLQPN